MMHPRYLLLLLIVALVLPASVAQARKVNDPGVITLATDVRDGPGAKAAVVGTVPAGHQVTVLEMRGPSARVKSSVVNGWVPTSKVRIGGGGARASSDSGAGGGLFRGLTGLFGGGGSSSTKVPVGLRGLTKQDIASAQPNPAAVRKAESMSVSAADARAFARSAGVSSRDVAYLSAGSGSGGSSGGLGGFFSGGGSAPDSDESSGADN